MKKILIMGLQGSGKTTLAKELINFFPKAKWLNADKVRKEAKDWDFSLEGRKRQAERMFNLAKKFNDEGKLVIADFVCPTPIARKSFNPDYVVWLDTIEKGRFEDTNQMFTPPEKFDLRIKEKNAIKWSKEIYNQLSIFDKK